MAVVPSNADAISFTGPVHSYAYSVRQSCTASAVAKVLLESSDHIYFWVDLATAGAF
jgi:hypothetical protein